MRVEVINTGSELLLGHVVNTHVKFLAEALQPLGLRISAQSCVPDGDDIRVAIADASRLADLILVTGGLGPTSDDLTREVVAEALGLELQIDPTILTELKEFFRSRGYEMPTNNQKQAMVPVGAEVLSNPNGTAPGLFFPRNLVDQSPAIALLPGPPRELYPMVRDVLIPILNATLPKEAEKQIRVYHLTGVGESTVEEKVGKEIESLIGVELGYCARPGEVDVRLIGSDVSVAEAGAIVERSFTENIYSITDENLESVVVHSLQAQKLTLAVAESCTGGLLAHRITNVSGASTCFLAGYTTYSNDAKSDVLGVTPETLEEFGAVSSEVAKAMAKGAIKRANADFALSTTGIAGPTGGSDEKPVGTVYIALAQSNKPTVAKKFRFRSDRETFKQLATQTALNMLRLQLRK